MIEVFSSECFHWGFLSASEETAGVLQSSPPHIYPNSKTHSKSPRFYCINTQYQGYVAYLSMQQYSSKVSFFPALLTTGLTPKFIWVFCNISWKIPMNFWANQHISRKWHAIHKMTWISWGEFTFSHCQTYFSQKLNASHLVPLSYHRAVCRKGEVLTLLLRNLSGCISDHVPYYDPHLNTSDWQVRRVIGWLFLETASQTSFHPTVESISSLLHSNTENTKDGSRCAGEYFIGQGLLLSWCYLLK